MNKKMQTGLCVCGVSDSLLLFSSIKMIFLLSDLSPAYPAVLAREERLWESERKTPTPGFWEQQGSSQPIMRPSFPLMTLGASGMP